MLQSISISIFFSFNSRWLCIYPEAHVHTIAPNSETAVKTIFGILQVQHDWKGLSGVIKKLIRFLCRKVPPVSQDMYTPQITGCLSKPWLISLPTCCTLFLSICFQILKMGYIDWFHLVWLSEKEFCSVYKGAGAVECDV